jgi:hypothetical protein
MRKYLRHAAPAVVLGGMIALGASAASALPYFNGFETDTAGWDVFGAPFNATRVPTGTNGVTSSSGSFQAVSSAGSPTPATNWGGYSSVFPTGGYTTRLDIYLDLGATTVNNTRFDWDSAINDSSGSFRRDFIFNGGFFNDAGPFGAGDRFVISAGNNSQPGSAFARDPGHDPFAITATAWYTFEDRFYDNGGVLAVDMVILDSSHNVLHTWTRSDPSDLISGIGGNRYGWIDFNEFSALAFDNASRFDSASSDVPEPMSLALLGLGVVGLGFLRRAQNGRRGRRDAT